MAALMSPEGRRRIAVLPVGYAEADSIAKSLPSGRVIVGGSLFPDCRTNDRMDLTLVNVTGISGSQRRR